jgi:hypothetical protein
MAAAIIIGVVVYMITDNGEEEDFAVSVRTIVPPETRER